MVAAMNKPKQTTIRPPDDSAARFGYLAIVVPDCYGDPTAVLAKSAESCQRFYVVSCLLNAMLRSGAPGGRALPIYTEFGRAGGVKAPTA